jgi:hypothetical protein
MLNGIYVFDSEPINYVLEKIEITKPIIIITKTTMSVVYFKLINTQPLTFQVGAVRDEAVPKPMPAYLQTGMTVTLVSGIYPLNYSRWDGSPKHKYVFQKGDGSQFSMRLEGHTYDCVYPLEKQQELIKNNIGIYVEEIPTEAFQK